jgi:Tfp pilus assembly protein PilX
LSNKYQYQISNNDIIRTEKHIKLMKKGQILLITLLVLTVAITVALSLIGRSTTDIGITGQVEESSRAFSAAEAGIEEALQTQIGTGATSVQTQAGVSFTTEVVNVGATGTSAYTYPADVKEGDAATIWLASHNEDGTFNEADHYCAGVVGACTIDVCWKYGTTIPAVEIMTYYKDGTYQVTRGSYDPDGGRAGSNKFTTPPTDANAGCGATSEMYRQTITLPSGTPLFLRIRPYYADATILIAPSGGRTLPSQGIEVTSVGRTDNGVTRKIVVKRQYETPASVFDFTLYSQDVITHE